MLKNVLVIQGIAFLEPTTVEVIHGSITEEREALRDFDFTRALHRKLGFVNVLSGFHDGSK